MVMDSALKTELAQAQKKKRNGVGHSIFVLPSASHDQYRSLYRETTLISASSTKARTRWHFRVGCTRVAMG